VRTRTLDPPRNFAEMIPLREAAKLLPRNPTTGKAVSVSTIWRWARKGLPLQDPGTKEPVRVRLGTVQVGLALFTSEAALHEFCRVLADAGRWRRAGSGSPESGARRARTLRRNRRTEKASSGESTRKASRAARL
jgi:hypothetical protein